MMNSGKLHKLKILKPDTLNELLKAKNIVENNKCIQFVLILQTETLLDILSDNNLSREMKIKKIEDLSLKLLNLLHEPFKIKLHELYNGDKTNPPSRDSSCSLDDNDNARNIVNLMNTLPPKKSMTTKKTGMYELKLYLTCYVRILNHTLYVFFMNGNKFRNSFQVEEV